MAGILAGQEIGHGVTGLRFVESQQDVVMAVKNGDVHSQPLSGFDGFAFEVRNTMGSKRACTTAAPTCPVLTMIRTRNGILCFYYLALRMGGAKRYPFFMPH
jgi:hypothetical protein